MLSRLLSLIQGPRRRTRRRPAGTEPAEQLECRLLLTEFSLFASQEHVHESDASTLDLRITTAEPVVGDQQVSLAVSGVGVTADDYSLSDTVVHIPDGRMLGTVSLRIKNDNVVERVSETIQIEVTGFSAGLSAGDTQRAELFVTDDDFAEIRLEDASVLEAAGTATVVVSLSQPVDADVSLVVETGDGSADATDFTADSYNVTFLPGETTKTIAVPILNDSVTEENETFVARVTGVRSERENVGAVPDVISPRNVSVGSLDDFQFTPDRTQIVYLAGHNNVGRPELYRVDVDGGDPVRLVTGLLTASRIREFALSPDGRTVVFTAIPVNKSHIELFRVSVDGGVAERLNAPLVPVTAAIDSFRISPDSQFVVYVARQDGLFRNDLYRVPIDGGDTTRLSGGSNEHISVTSFEILPDSTSVVYIADQTAESRFELFVVPSTGGNALTLNGPVGVGGDVQDFAITPDGTHVIFRGDLEVNHQNDLYAVDLSTRTPVRITTEFDDAAGTDVSNYAINSSGAQVIYSTNTSVNGSILFSAPTAGGAVAALDSPSSEFRRIYSSHLSPDGAYVVFTANTQDDTRIRLHSAELATGQVRVLVDEPNAHVDLDVLITSNNQVIYQLNGVLPKGYEFYSIPVTGGDATRLSPDDQTVAYVVTHELSHDEQFVIYQTWTGQPQRDVYAVPVGGGPAKLIIDASEIGSRRDPPVAEHDPLVIVQMGADLVSAAPPGVASRLLTQSQQVHGASDVRLSPDGHYAIYVGPAAEGNGQRLYSVDLRDGTVRTLSDTFPQSNVYPLFFITSDGLVIYQTNFNELFSVPASGGVPTSLYPLTNPFGHFFSFQLTADHQTAVVHFQHAGAAMLYSIPVRGGRPVLLSKLLYDQEIERFIVSPAGDRVAWIEKGSTGRETLRVSSIAGGPANVLAADAVRIEGEQFSPDGDKLLFREHLEQSSAATLFNADLTTGQVYQISPTVGIIGQTRFTPDSRQILFGFFSTVTGGTSELYVAPLDGSSPRKLNGPWTAQSTLRSLWISPDGKYVVYSWKEGPTGRYDLYSVHLESYAIAKLTSDETAGHSHIRQYQISQDGQYVVFLADAVEDRFELFRTRIDGTDSVRLNQELIASSADVMSFTMAGDYAVFSVNPAGPVSRELYAARLSDAELFRLDSTTTWGRHQGLGTVVDDYRVHGKRVIYAQRDNAGRFSVHVTDVENQANVKVSPTVSIFNSIDEFVLTNDGTQALFTSDHAADEYFSLFRSNVTPSATITIIDDDYAKPDLLLGPIVHDGNKIAAPTPLIEGNEYVFRYRAVEGATEYQVRYISEGGSWVTVPGTQYRSDATGYFQSRIDVRARLADGSLSAEATHDVGLCATIEIDPLPRRGSDRRPVISWNEARLAARFEIWINNLTTGENAVIHRADLTTNSFRPFENLNFGRYRIWVRAFDRFNRATAWSSPVEYSLGPQPLSPIDATRNRRPTFEWTTIPGATVYELYIATSVDPIHVRSISDDQWTPTVDLPAGSLRWWIRGIAENGVAGLWSAATSADIGRPLLNAATDHRGFVTLTWSQLTDSDVSEIVIQKLDSAGPLIRETVADHSLILNTLPDGEYAAWARSKPAGGTYSHWSRRANFALSANMPTAPITPDEHSQVARPLLEWWSVSGAVSYEVHLTNGANSITGSTDQTEWTPLEDLDAGLWVWQVRPELSSGDFGAWSIPVQFLVNTRVTEVIEDTSQPDFGLMWQALPQISTYDVFLQGPDGTTSTTRVAGTQLRRPELGPLVDGIWSVWIRGVDGVDVGRWSQRQEWNVQSPSPLTATPVSDYQQVQTLQPQLEWQAAAGATAWDIDIRGGSTRHIVRVTESTWTPDPGMLNYGAWTWSVRAIDAGDQPGSWSDPATLVISRFAVLTSPSPTTSSTMPLFAWTPVDSATHYYLYVQDEAGNEILFERNLTGTSHTSTLAFAPGSYRAWLKTIFTYDTGQTWSLPYDFEIV